MGFFRRVSVLTLVITLSLIGIPLPIHAADDESPPSRILTINGHALSQLLNRTAPGDPLALAGTLGQETGQISGVAVDGDGQPLAAQAVRLKRVFTSLGDRAEVSGSDTTNADGAFSFTGLQASDYLVEMLVDDQVIASASLTLAEGVMQVGGVTLSQPEEGGRRVGLWLGIGAGVAGLLLFMGTCLNTDCFD